MKSSRRLRRLCALPALLSPLLLGLSLAGTAAAEDSGSLLGSALQQLPDRGARFLKEVQGRQKSAEVLVRVDGPETARSLGLVSIGAHFAVAHRSPDGLATLAETEGVRGISFTPPRYPLMDVAAESIGSNDVHNESGLLGEGTVVGVVDTGADFTHPSLIAEDGSSRISWLLIFGVPPRGVHQTLEEQYGCDGEDPCAIYSRDDLDAILRGDEPNDIPRDRVGHGTHIASLAGGSDPVFTGVAPLADLIIVSAAGSGGGVSDARILLGTQFVFDRAGDENKPAAVNISLGSSFGAHDGSSTVEEGLAELGSGPGRAIVLAAGNDGDLFTDLTDDYPEPLGLHTEVAVLDTATVRVPILSPPTPNETTTGSLFAWIATNPGEEISVGFHNGRGVETNLVPPGEAGGLAAEEIADADDYDIVILNGVSDFDGEDGIDAEIFPGSVVVALAGTWETGRAFELLLEATPPRIFWATGTGQVSSLANGFGPLIPRARSAGTITVPGTSEALITIGASVNRNEWVDSTGSTVGLPWVLEERAEFSAFGPNLSGAMKPELVAPGGAVIGAMAETADPRDEANRLSLFANGGSCPEDSECFVVDDSHAVASGTSMAAPIATAAIALMMQRDPDLTMSQAKRYLMAGSRPVPGETLGSGVGTGGLDIVGALQAQERDVSGETIDPSPEDSWVVWADHFARPTPLPPLRGYAVLKNEDGEPAGSAETDLRVEVSPGASAEWEYESTGLFSLVLRPDPSSTTEELIVRVLIDEELIGTETIRVERDATLAEVGYALSGGTCAFTQGRTTPRNAPSRSRSQPAHFFAGASTTSSLTASRQPCDSCGPWSGSKG